MTRSTSGPPGSSPGGPPGAVDLEPCAQCGNPVASRALFCHACGAIQPPRPLDPFARLGLERRFDLDLAQVQRQFAGFGRALAPERVAARGPREQANAKAQSHALADAHATLRDPIRRARALLDLLKPGPIAVAADPDDDTRALAVSLALAIATSGDNEAAVGRIARDLDQRIEACLTYLTPAIRKAQEDASKADAALRMLARLERLTRMAAEAKARRFP